MSIELIGVCWNIKIINYIHVIFYLRMQAAKAGVLAFFDTLRVEVGDSVGITIVMPGWIESEITKGKMHQEHGEIGVNQVKRDVRILPQLYQSYSAYMSVSYIVSPNMRMGRKFDTRVLVGENLDYHIGAKMVGIYLFIVDNVMNSSAKSENLKRDSPSGSLPCVDNEPSEMKEYFQGGYEVISISKRFPYISPKYF
jgi:hypothetical protein